jgi:hypothetical protein
MKNLPLENITIIISVIIMISTYFVLKYKENNEKWYKHITFAFLFGVSSFLFSLLIIKTCEIPLLHNSIMALILSLIILLTAKNKFCLQV